MDVYAWKNYGKRLNSTAQPDLADMIRINAVRFKEDTSTINPHLIVTSNSANINKDITYMNVQGRYYYVTDMTYKDGNLVEFSLESDPLATARDYIMSYEGYVERTNDESYINELIIDDAYPTNCKKISATSAKSRYIQQYFTLDSFGTYYCIGFSLPIKNVNIDPSTGAYTIGSVNYQDAILKGTSGYVLMNSIQFRTFWSQITTIGVSADFNIFDYIISCVALPTMPAGGSNPSKAGAVQIGSHSVIFVYTSRVPDEGSFMVDSNGVMDWFTSNRVDIDNQSLAFLKIEIPGRPSDTYLNYAPFKTLTLYAGVFGAIEIPADMSEPEHYLFARINVDVTTGDAILSLYYPTRMALVGKFNGKMGIDCPVQRMSNYGLNDMLSIITKSLTLGSGALLSAVSGNALGAIGGIASTAVGIGTGLYNASIPKLKGLGVCGSTTVNLYDEFFYFVAEYAGAQHKGPDQVGEPCYMVRPLSDFATGSYVKLINPSIACPKLYAPEIEKINTGLSNGIYLD